MTLADLNWGGPMVSPFNFSEAHMRNNDFEPNACQSVTASVLVKSDRYQPRETVPTVFAYQPLDSCKDSIRLLKLEYSENLDAPVLCKI
jgi:hypothetical protein